MRVREVLLDHLSADGHVVVAEGAAELMAGLPNRDSDRVGSGQPGPGDILLTPTATPAAITAALQTLPEGALLAAPLDQPLTDLPVPALVEAVLAGGGQVRDLTPIRQAGVTALLLVLRSSTTVAPTPYLRPGAPAEPVPDAAVRRVLAERAVETVVTRAREQRDAERADRAEAQVADLRTRLEQARTDAKAEAAAMRKTLQRRDERLQMLETSEALRVGRALAELRRHPLRGTRHLLRAMRPAAEDSQA